MIRKSRQTRDELLEEQHQRWLETIRDSELPVSLASSIYSFSPLSVEVGQTPPPGREKKSPADDHSDDLPF
jgi:hypothetical protein